MLIHLTPNDSRPMYEQVVDGIQRLIALEILGPGEMLPSIRALSKELVTSGITIRRAYQELERSGFIYTRAGKGSFVSELSQSKLTTWKMTQVQKPLRESIRRAQKLQLTEAEFQQTIKLLWEQETKGEKK